jgi:pimeloyl-ACP methyl ester carboxylesterase
MGGMMALQRSADAPGQCAGLILLSATTRFGGSAEAPHGTSPRVLRAMKAAMARNPDSVLRDFFRKCAAPAVLPDDVAAAQVAAALNTGVEHLRAGLDYLERTDLQGLVAGSELPVLVCHGDEDRIIPWQAGRDLAAALPRARFVRFNGIGHDLPLRAPAELAQHITAFIRTCRSTTKE